MRLDPTKAQRTQFNCTVIENESQLLQTYLPDREGVRVIPELSENIFVSDVNEPDALVEIGYIDGELQELSRINLHEGVSGARDFVFDPVRRILYYVGLGLTSGDPHNGNLYAIDVDTNEIIASLPTCFVPTSPAVDTVTGQVYVACGWTEKLLVFGYR